MRASRLRRGWTLEKAASRARMSRTTLASLERGGGSVASLLRLLTVLAPKARRRAMERTHWGEGHKADRDVRFTPAEFLAKINNSFGAIDLDPVVIWLTRWSRSVASCSRKAATGPSMVGPGGLAFVNPPFSRRCSWLKRAHQQWSCGNVGSIVCLVPARRIRAGSTKTFVTVEADIFLLLGRVRFADIRGKSQHTPFSLMLVAFGTSVEQRARWAEIAEGYWLAGCAAAGLLPDRPVVDDDAPRDIDTALDQPAQPRLGAGDALLGVGGLEGLVDDLPVLAGSCRGHAIAAAAARATRSATATAGSRDVRSRSGRAARRSRCRSSRCRQPVPQR
ncbi:hypothetical protein AB5I41_16475 [Sphingomonas sp. MMS24-JH45]